LRQVLGNPEKGARLGQKSLEIIRNWSFIEDVKGLKMALTSDLK
jgi:hypothetical protein